MRFLILLAVVAVALPAQESGQEGGKMLVTVRSVKNAPAGLPGIDKRQRCTISATAPGVVRYGKMVAFPESWEAVHPAEEAKAAKAGDKPVRYQPVLGEPVLVGLEVEAKILPLEGRRCVVGKVTLREVLGHSKLKLDLDGPVVEVPRVAVSTARFQLFPPQIGTTTCRIARPGGKPIEVEVSATEIGE
jgi:hypothetical protein